MALAAGDFSVVSRTPLGPGLYRIIVNWTLPASYTSGGEPLTNAILAAKMGIKSIKAVIAGPAIDVTNNKSLKIGFDRVRVAGTSQGKLRAFADGGSAADGAAEVAATHDLHTFVAQLAIDGV